MGTSMSTTERRQRRIWRLMVRRCTDLRDKSYGRYGGRGILVCNEWIVSFDAFREWAEKHGYDDTLEIDRKNSDGDYSPGNCRWATRAQNIQNIPKRRVGKSKFKGVGKTKYNKWFAQLKTHGVNRHLGCFPTEEDAARAYDECAKSTFGAFASLNFPELTG